MKWYRLHLGVLHGSIARMRKSTQRLQTSLSSSDFPYGILDDLLSASIAGFSH